MPSKKSAKRKSTVSGRTSKYRTDQESFWAGEQGDAYYERHHGPIGGTAADFENRVTFWSHVVDWTAESAPNSVIELGANIGLNLRAIRHIHRDLELATPGLVGVEINAKAYDAMVAEEISALRCSIRDMPADVRAEMVITMGVLIHIAPQDLATVYDVIAQTSSRYVLMAEYFCPSPREIEYRGEARRCWARDFAGEFMDRYPQFKLGDYGFVYKRDLDMPLDNLNWFIMHRSLDA